MSETGFDAVVRDCPLLADAVYSLQIGKTAYFGYFVLRFRFIRASSMQFPAGVKMGIQGPVFIWNPAFWGKGQLIASLDDARLVVLHECMHILLQHPSRVRERDPYLANIAMDMVINELIDREFGLRVSWAWKLPADGGRTLMFEPVYAWLFRDGRNYRFCPGSLSMFDTAEKGLVDIPCNKGGRELVDDHDIALTDVDDPDISTEGDMTEAEQRHALGAIQEQLLGRGLTSGIAELAVFVPARRPSLIRLFHHMQLRGQSTGRSYARPNRRVEDVKGRIREKRCVTVVLDTSGSMYDLLDSVISVVISEFETRVIMIDTELRGDSIVRNRHDWTRLKKAGCGGTILQPAIDRLIAAKEFSPLYMLTDGCCDVLDFSKFCGPAFVFTTNRNPIVKGRCTIVNISGIVQRKK